MRRPSRVAVAAFLLLAVSPAAAQDPDSDPSGLGRLERLQRPERFDRLERLERGGRRIGDRGVHLRILRDYHLPSGAIANEPIVVIGGSATIDGRAEHDIVVVGGTARIGPNAIVRGSVVAVGGEAVIDPDAQVAGEIDEVSIMGPDIDVAWVRRDGWWTVAALGATLLRLALILIVSLVLTVVTPGWIGSISRAASVGASTVLGVAGQILFVPALVSIAVALLISIVGIPLLAGLPLLVGGAAVLWAAGFAAVAVRVGRRLRGGSRSDGGVADLFTGLAAITALTLVAHIIALGPAWMSPFALLLGFTGLAIEYIAWTVGLGAAIASLFGGRRDTPPPVPVPI